MAHSKAAAYPKQLRMLRAEEFRAVFSRAKKISTKSFIVKYKKNERPFPRLGILIAKKKSRVPSIEIASNELAARPFAW